MVAGEGEGVCTELGEVADAGHHAAIGNGIITVKGQVAIVDDARTIDKTAAATAADLEGAGADGGGAGVGAVASEGEGASAELEEGARARNQTAIGDGITAIKGQVGIVGDVGGITNGATGATAPDLEGAGTDGGGT